MVSPCRLRWIAVGTVLFLGAVGCKPAPPPFIPVNGTVTINGSPLANAKVRFVPLEEGLDASFICTAVTDSDGKYSLTPPGKSEPGGCACKSKVLVSEGPAPDEAYGAYMRGDPGPMDRYNKSLKNRPIPTNYGRMSGSPFVVTVTADQETYDFELNR